MKGIPTLVRSLYRTYSMPKKPTSSVSSSETRKSAKRPRMREAQTNQKEKKHVLSILLLKNLPSTTAYAPKHTTFPNTTCVPSPHQKNPK